METKINQHLNLFGLKADQDAFGNNIYETYISGKFYSGYEIGERSDGYFTLYGDSNAYFEPFEEWSSIQKELSSDINGVILDIGCGGGKHALYFQEKGQKVYAMDNSPKAIDTCKLRGIENTIVCDVEHFHLVDTAIKFDSILFWGNNVGLLQNKSFFVYFLNLLENYTNSNSTLYLETMNPYEEGFLDEDTVSYVENNLLQKKLGGQMSVRVRYKKYATPWNDYLFISADELEQLLTETSWQTERILKDFETNQFIAVLKKKKSFGLKQG